MEMDEIEHSMQDQSESSDADTTDSEADLMVTTRARRTTAGNRYSALVAQEEIVEDDEDEVAMLFAEGEGEDDDFNSDDGDEDADMSSSDDDDQGPNAGQDDFEGENEIKNEVKFERAKKRKADLALTTVAGIRKRPKTDPTSLRKAPVPKPLKRKERVSWLPDSDIIPGRTSLRKQTILHRAETHAKLKENEEQRLRLKARREKRNQEREAEAPKDLTQADRLAEAERVERRNAKSLNRWEAMEKKRAEEQAAKLAALKERKLEGAVVTWYSSSAKYFGLKEIEHVEPGVPHEAKKRGRKPKALLEQLAAAKLAQNEASRSHSNETKQGTSGAVLLSARTDPTTELPTAANGSQGTNASVVGALSAAPKLAVDAQTESVSPRTQPDASFLSGIHDYAADRSDSEPKRLSTQRLTVMENSDSDVLQGGDTQAAACVDEPAADIRNIETCDERLTTPSVAQEVTEKPTQLITTASLEVSTPQKHPHGDSAVPGITPVSNILQSHPGDTAPPKVELESRPLDAALASHPLEENVPAASVEAETTATTTSTTTTPSSPANITAAPVPTAAPPTEPPIEVVSTRNIVMLDKFDELPDRARHEFSLFYNSRKMAKPAKHHHELCPITGLAARYRDPATGIAYANMTAYKKLHELKDYQHTWSSMLGCYVGRTNVTARGVPEGFLLKP